MRNVRSRVVATVIGVGMALSASSALAQAQGGGGFYFGGSAGQSDVDVCGFVPSNVSCDDKDNAWRILGGYQINRNFSAELGYWDLGEVSASGPGGSARIEATAFDLVGVGSIPISDVFSLYGKLGVYRAEADLTSTVGVRGDDTSTDLTYGIGAQYDLSRNMALRAEWQQFSEVSDADVDVMSVGFVFRF